MPEVRRTGVASELSQRTLEHARAHGGTLLWCNARTLALPFYEAQGFSLWGDEVEIPGAGPHYVMFRAP